MPELSLQGVHVPIVTPFTADGDLDVASLERLARRLALQQVDGLVALGTTGEAASLEPGERQRVIDCCAAVCAETGMLLTVGAGSNSTRRTVLEVEELGKTAGVDAVMVVVPYYVRPAEKGVVAHYREVAAASPLPLLVYNVPARTARALSADALLELTAIEGIVGMKHAVGAVDDQTVQFMAKKPAGFDVLVGDDLYLLPMVALGATGGIMASAHFLSEAFAAVIDRAVAGALDTARSVAAPLAPLVEALFGEPNPAVFKALLHHSGAIDAPATRLPMQPASPAALAAAVQAFEAAAAAVSAAGVHLAVPASA